MFKIIAAFRSSLLPVVLCLMTGTCATPRTFDYKETWRLPKDQVAYVFLPSGLRVVKINDEFVAADEDLARVALKPAEHIFTVGLLVFQDRGFTAMDEELQVSIQLGPGGQVYLCPEILDGGKWKVTLAPAREKCPHGFQSPDGAPDKAAQRGIYFHGKARGMATADLFKVNLSPNAEVTHVDGKRLVTDKFRTLYLVPGQSRLGIGLDEHRADGSWIFSFVNQDVTLMGQKGTEAYICAKHMPENKWQPVQAKGGFACD